MRSSRTFRFARSMRTGVLLGGLLLGAGSAHATSIITNGSFESGTNPGSFLRLSAGATDLTSWTVSGDGIDYIGSFWTASNGSRSLDLNAALPGGISQSFTTVVGNTYQVAFDMAGNPGGTQGIKTLRVSAAGSFQDFTFSTVGKSTSNMGWTGKTFSFVAAATMTTLSFSSLGPFTNAGPAIDNVSVQPVPMPEPSTGLLLGLGLGALAARRRRGV
jgi:choice-of-anchor C domain-containing protein